MRIEVAGTITLEELQRASRIMWSEDPMFQIQIGDANGSKRLNQRQRYLILFLLLFFVALGVLSSRKDGGFSWSFGLCPLIVIAAAGFLYTGLYLFIHYRRWQILHVALPRLYRNDPKAFQWTYVLDDVGFVGKTAEAEEATICSWDDVESSKEDELLILLIERKRPENVQVVRTTFQFRTGATIHILPRRLLTDAQFQELSAFLNCRLSTPAAPIPPLPAIPATSPVESIRPATDGLRSSASEIPEKPE